MPPGFSNSVVRNKEDIGQAKPQFNRATREAAATKERLMISKEATTGAEAKLDLVNLQAELNSRPEDSVLENNVEVETFIENMERHAIRFDMAHFMQNFPILEQAKNDEADRFRSGKTYNLFTSWDLIGQDKDDALYTIGETIQWLKTYTDSASESYLEDMDWLHLHLLNSMSTRLRDEVTSTLKHDFPPSQHGGPLTFAVMIDKVINLSPAAIDTLKNNLINYSIKSVPGEDIALVVRRFLYAFRRLESNRSIDTTLIAGLYKVFQTTSVDEFNDQVKHMALSSKGSRGVRRSYKEILDEVKEHYLDIHGKGMWVGVTPAQQESSFIADTSTPNQQQKQITPPPGESPYCLPCDADKISSDPPRFQRTIKGRLMKYCIHCPRYRNAKTKFGRWNTTHFSDEHKGPKPGDSTSSPAAGNPGNKENDPVVNFADTLIDSHS